jgi:hypothetical protein
MSFGFWGPIFFGFFIAHEITEDVKFANIGFLISMVAITRLAMHLMWKKDEQAEDE